MHIHTIVHALSPPVSLPPFRTLANYHAFHALAVDLNTKSSAGDSILVCIYIIIYVCVYIYIYIYVYVCIYIYIMYIDIEILFR
jgi:hypothetical protein